MRAVSGPPAVVAALVLAVSVPFTFPASASAQATLLGPGTAVQWAFGPEVRTVGIQGDVSTTLGFTVGATFNRAAYIGFAMGSNVSHPRVNHSYAGLMAHYSRRADEAVHYGLDLFLGMGATKDYEQAKTNAFDNFANTSGPAFTLVAPGAHAELNLTPRARLYAGVGYRFASGLDEADPLIASTGVTAAELSGLSVSLGLKFGSY